MIRMVNVTSATNEEDLDKTRMVMYELEGYPGSRYFLNQESYRVRKLKETLIFTCGAPEDVVDAFEGAVRDELREDQRYDGCCNC